MNRVAVKGGRQAIVSTVDAAWAAGKRWHQSDAGYVRCYSGTPGGSPLRMHRLVMERVLSRPLRADELVDHINGDRFDNRRGNLRLATKSQNGMNRRLTYGRSRYLGVCFDRSRSKWMAYANLDGHRVYLGRYSSEIEAAWMRDQLALALHGHFAALNFEYVKVGDVA